VYTKYKKYQIINQCGIPNARKLLSNTITGLLPLTWISSCGNYCFFSACILVMHETYYCGCKALYKWKAATLFDEEHPPHSTTLDLCKFLYSEIFILSKNGFQNLSQLW
jgi:hypothetical protein